VIDSSDAPEVNIVMDWCMGKLDAIQGHPVDQDFDGDHVVQAAYWWGNKDVAEAVIDAIGGRHSYEAVILDLRGPREFMPESDFGLLACFGQSEPKFWPVLRDLLLSKAPKLKDLRLITDQEASDAEDLIAAGFKLVDEPLIVPADFAAFSVLAD
jgi:hypothetical protein